MKMKLLEEALLPYELKIASPGEAQEVSRGKEVERPTYERYITGPMNVSTGERMPS